MKQRNQDETNKYIASEKEINGAIEIGKTRLKT